MPTLLKLTHGWCPLGSGAGRCVDKDAYDYVLQLEQQATAAAPPAAGGTQPQSGPSSASSRGSAKSGGTQDLPIRSSGHNPVAAAEPGWLRSLPQEVNQRLQPSASRMLSAPGGAAVGVASGLGELVLDGRSRSATAGTMNMVGVYGRSRSNVLSQLHIVEHSILSAHSRKLTH